MNRACADFEQCSQGTAVTASAPRFTEQALFADPVRPQSRQEGVSGALLQRLHRMRELELLMKQLKTIEETTLAQMDAAAERTCAKAEEWYQNILRTVPEADKACSKPADVPEDHAGARLLVIRPQFDIRVRSDNARKPRPGETLVSLRGSPVMFEEPEDPESNQERILGCEPSSEDSSINSNSSSRLLLVAQVSFQMERYYAQGLQQPIFQYVPRPRQRPPVQPRRQGPGILKYPFGYCDAPKTHSVKTLRFEMDQIPEPAEPQSDVPEPSENKSGGTTTVRSSISSANTTDVEDDEASGHRTGEEVRTPSSLASTAESVDLTVSSGKSSSATSGRSEQLGTESDIASSSARTSVTSVSSRPIPKDIKRYFRRHARRLSETTNTQASTSVGTGDDQRHAQSRQDSEEATSRRYALLTALTVVSTLLLAGISAELYNALLRGPKERTPLMLLENTIAGAPPEPEGEAMPVVPPRVVYRGGRRYGHVTPEKEWGAHRAEDEVRTTESSVYTPEGNAVEEHMPASTAITADQGDKPGTERADVNEIIGGWDDGKEPLWAAFKSHNGSACDAPSFTYCQRPRHEFFYESAIGTCVSTATHRLGVCTRGTNRFSSKRSCLKECVAKKRPSEQCSHPPLFMECDRGDVLSTLWHFDGRSCKNWNFTSGLCPAHGDDGAFFSREECLATCAGRYGRSRLCRVSSRPDHCHSDQLKFPFFVAAGKGKKRPLYCLNVSSTNYGGHRCLVGANRFFSMKACLKTCASNRSDT
ncbi:hypothetical protein HPB50_024896 [Hyalomma asiaticum]|uniref:Uncharacterized protein n=1 Tax=Hyalomma asiaticum TaxID=266040 RepID=A0ACB7TNW2_HYAAI|nr:hypothetical protein HPB50_024896 [Hyalomma asiaticum]